MTEKAYEVLIKAFHPERMVLAILRVREITGVGLAEAHEKVKSVPVVVMNGMFLSQAEELAEVLREALAQVEIRLDAAHKPDMKVLPLITFGEPLESIWAKGRLRERIEAVRRLWNDWDPADKSGVEPARYDSYVIPSLRLIERNASVGEIAAYLSWVTAEHMADVRSASLEEFAYRLCQCFSGPTLH